MSTGEKNACMNVQLVCGSWTKLDTCESAKFVIHLPQSQERVENSVRNASCHRFHIFSVYIIILESVFPCMNLRRWSEIVDSVILIM